MTETNLSIKLRPIKIAFLVNPTDTKALAKAIEINSTLWGGTYNPIIPTFEKIPSVWKKEGGAFGHTSRTILKGYIEAFNPDFLVPLGKAKKLNLKEFRQEIIDEKRLSINLKEGTTGYGISIFEVLQGFFKKEFKFKRRYPINYIFPSFPKENKLFLQSVFGAPSKDVEKILDKNWKEPFEAKSVKLNLGNYLQYMRHFYLRQMLKFEIKASNNSGWNRGECVFLMNASNNQDIIDYWNLRAMGWSVLPIPKQAMHSNSAKKNASEFIEANSGVSKHNKQIYYYATLMKSRSIDIEDVKTFANSLKIKKDKDFKGPRFSITGSYPRIWDEWARHRDGVGSCDLESKSENHDFTDSSEEISVKTLDPEFAFRFGGGGARFANDVVIANYMHDDLYAAVIPEGGRNLTRALSSIGLNEWRFSKRSTTYLSEHTNWRINLKVPKADEVFTNWMRDQNLEINLSSPGRIAKQMLKHLGGTFGINTLANDYMISLLKSMESGKEMAKEQFWAEISKIASSGTFKREPAEILKNYVAKKIFQLGVSLKCPTCTHSSWHDIPSLTYTVTCPSCLEEFNIPTHSPDDIKWSYKATGPFTLPKRAEGVYATLLTLRIFSSIFHHSPITPMLSFETKIDDQAIEVDLGLFFRESNYRKEDATRLIFAECKTENDFTKKDIDKMKVIAEKFPGAVLVFATLKEELTEREISLLKPLVNKARRYYKNEEPYNPVLILTKTELFTVWDVFDSWKEKGGKHAAFAKQHAYQNELLNICDITQQLYLGMKPWGQFTQEEFEKKFKKKTGPTTMDATQPQKGAPSIEQPTAEEQ
ncbi:MAG: hypothetical protein V4449_01380 [Patescibacteria group bacterium]